MNMAWLWLSHDVLFIAGIVACCLYLFYWWLLCKPISGIPYNKEAVHTVFGDIFPLLKAIEKDGCLVPWIVSNNRKHNSPIVQMWLKPFSRPLIILSDFRESQDLLLRRSKEFDRSTITSDVFVGAAPDMHLSMRSDDERFKPHKNLLKDLMTPAFLNQVAAPRIYASVSNLIEFWSLKAQLAQEQPFYAFKNNASLVLDAITAITFGLDLEEGILASQTRHLSHTSDAKPRLLESGAVEFRDAERSPTLQALVTLADTLEDTMKAALPRLYHWYTRQTSLYRRAYRLKEDMIRSEVDAAILRIKDGQISQKCTLDNMLQRELTDAQKTGRQPKYHSRAIYDESLGFLLGGYDTTSSTLAWLWKQLSANQYAQATLRSSLYKAYPQATAETRNPTIDEIIKTNVPYLDAIIEENHRCAAIVPLLLRRALVDTTIMGHPIKKGTEVGMISIGPDYMSPSLPLSEIQRSESSRAAKDHVGSWDPASMDQFKPERWLKVDEKGNQVFDANAGPMLAFSAGPRGCFGRRLAYLQIRIILVMILWNFELLEVDGELGSFKPNERLSRVPVYCYIRLREIKRQVDDE